MKVIVAGLIPEPVEEDEEEEIEYEVFFVREVTYNETASVRIFSTSEESATDAGIHVAGNMGMDWYRDDHPVHVGDCEYETTEEY